MDRFYGSNDHLEMRMQMVPHGGENKYSNILLQIVAMHLLNVTMHLMLPFTY